jgi:undecaprenyl-diphosphatase
MTSAIGASPPDVAEVPGTVAAAVVESVAIDSMVIDSAAIDPATLNVGAAVVMLAAAGLFALIAHRVATKKSQPCDQRVREVMQAHRSPALDVVARPVTLLSIPIVVVSATAALAWWLKSQRRNEAALAVAVTPLVAGVAGQSFSTFLAQRNPPDAGDAPNGEVTEPSFPSGHTTGVTAEALGVAYILSRERLATSGILATLVAWPLLVGVTRVYRDRHWVSDILGGWAAGTSVAAMSALLYEWRRRAFGRSEPTAKQDPGDCTLRVA